MATPVQSGAGPVRTKVLEESYVMSGYIVLVFLVLVSVYISRIPESILQRFKSFYYKVGGFFMIILLTSMYGWIHGILAALAFALVVSRSYRHEGFTPYTPALLIGDSDGTTVIHNSHRWLIEEILGEHPKIIYDKDVTTRAIDDASETTRSSRSSK